MRPSSHEDYFASASPEARRRLERIRAEVERRLPGIERCIAYSMPAFRRGKVFFCFAAFKRHIGIYPPLNDDPALVAELEPFRGPKGNLSFPLDQPLPLALIGRVAVALHRQYSGRT
jgi:uncharacterized protein YdhG (YjbR/CyaY superfamily)